MSVRSRRVVLVVVFVVIAAAAALSVAHLIAASPAAPAARPGNTSAPAAPPETSSGASRSPSTPPLAGPVDAGSQPDATGVAVSRSNGDYSYTVASGDSISAIAYRFGLCNADIYDANSWLDGHDDQLRVGQPLTIERVPGARHDAADCHTSVYG